MALIGAGGGLLIWALAFVLIYGAHGIGCARGWSDHPMLGTNLHIAILAAIWIAGLCAIAGFGLLARRPVSDSDTSLLLDRLKTGLAAVSFLALAVTGGPILLFPACV